MPENMDAFFDRLLELWNSPKLELVNQLFSEQVERLDPDLRQPTRGTGPIADYIAGIHSAFPDFKLTMKRPVVSADQIAFEWTCTGTHKGVFQGIPATGKRVTVSGVTLYRIQNNKIIEEHVYFDRLAMLQQLGAVPGPAHGGSTSAGQ